MNVETKIDDNSNENRGKIIVQYKDDPVDAFTKVDLILNATLRVRIAGDTVLFTDAPVSALQVKSYLFHEGLMLPNPPLIDTIYSPKIEVSEDGKYKMIVLKLAVKATDFFRVRLVDTLTIKNNRRLVWRKTSFNKIKE